MRPFTFISLSLTLAAFGLAACTPMVKQALDNQRPQVSVVDQHITGLDFERVSIAFGLKVDNPNPIGITLEGLDYDLKLDGHSFLTGKQDKQMQIAASGASRIELPLSMTFKEIKVGLSGLKGKDEVPYELTTGLLIKVPLLGTYRYPVVSQGVMPVPQLPAVSLQNLKVQNLSFTGATLALQLLVDNPNNFSVALNTLDYGLKINGKQWASGHSQTLGNIKEKQKSVISLPVTVSLMDLGAGFSNLLKGGEELNYEIVGKLSASTSNKLIGNFDMPLETNGRVKVMQ
jgi:LEA14-like dessication related protein